MIKIIRLTTLILLIMCVQMKSSANTVTEKTKVLVLFHSETGGTYKLALAIAEGIRKYPNTEAVLKRIPVLQTAKSLKVIDQYPVATIDELGDYDGIAFGSPVNFANISADMHTFFNQTITIWSNRKLEGKPATVFMSAGSGAGKEAAILSFWNRLALHGMVLVSTGLMATETLDTTVPQGNTPFGATSLAAAAGERPSVSELNVARAQGEALAKVAVALHLSKTENTALKDTAKTKAMIDVNAQLKKNNIILPEAPKPVGNYVPYVISDHKVYINQVALLNGKVMHAGKIGAGITEEQAKAATYQTMLNVLAVLKEAVNGDLNKVKRVVQLTGFFYTGEGYTDHASLMNSASDLAVKVFADKGKHARATIGAVSLPLNSPVEIQAVFEIE